MDNQPFVPAELERDIFETTALLYPKTIPNLLRVARRVLIWIEPFLYRVVRFEVPHNPGIHALLQKPPEFWNLAVRHLVLLDTGDDALRLLNTCNGITSLGIGSSYPDSTISLASILPDSRIRRLAVQLPRISPELRRSLFAAITHLAVLDVAPSILTSFCAEIPHLPPSRTARSSSSTTTFREMCSCRYHRLLRDVPTVHDVRFVLALGHGVYWDVWDEYWSRAEEFIAKKRRREIAETRYWLDEPGTSTYTLTGVRDASTVSIFLPGNSDSTTLVTISLC
ncbi:hypothetical protein C8R46DRAFT_1349417 [Mycena filopes]|nr:hypothetical protein C8R46DRAFT_1349417 [Mycena filopes]